MRILVFACLCLLAYGAVAQSNFKPGYVVLNSGDTVHGEINAANWLYNPEKITFRSAGANQEYNVQNLKAFGITGEDQYIRYNISYQLSAMEVEDAQENFDFPVETKDAWLRVLYRSNYTLLEYNTPRRVYFFVDPEGEGIKELIYRVRLRNGELQKDEQYKNLLQLYADEGNNSARVQRVLENAEYNSNSLVKVFDLLNSGKSSFQTKKSMPVKTDVMIGIGYYTFSASGQVINDGTGAYYLNTTDFEGTAGIRAGIGITLSSRRNNGRFQSRAGLNFVNISLKGENTNSGSFQKETYEGTILVVEPNFNFLVLFNPQQKTRFLAGPSFGYNIVIKNNVEGTFENPGVVINRKEFPPINGFLTPGIDFIVEGNFGKVQLQYSRLMNMIDKRFTTLTGNAFTISYGYVFKKRAD